MENLFTTQAWEPLHALMRPKRVDAIVGQKHLMAPGQPIRSIIDSKTPASFILQGPPGSGKTSIARVVTASLGLPCEALNATSDGIPALRKIIEKAREAKSAGRSPTILFVDEIARWSQTQQDALLPDIESGLIMLIGCTTENVSFTMRSALLSRVETYRLRPLTEEDMHEIISKSEKISGVSPILSPEATAFVIPRAHGDARTLITLLSASLRMNNEKTISLDTIKKAAESLPSAMSTDRHYALLSALQKSIRSSDPQATALYVAMLIQDGEPEDNIFRRLLTIASEDIGLADSNGIVVTQACYDAFKRSGPPEGRIPLMHAAIYLATAPKSNSAYKALKTAMKWVKEHPNTAPPKHIINAPTQEMKKEGYREGYLYDHDFPNGISYQDCLPEVISRKNTENHFPFYVPLSQGEEREKEASEIEKHRRSLAEKPKSDLGF